jgi:magnesium and cobalt transporter
MSEDRPSAAPGDGRQQRSWLERLGQVLQPEPKDREELLDIVKEARQRDLLDADAFSMIEGVLEVAETQARDIMIPRSQMEVVERDVPLQEMLPTIIKGAHSRFPVIGDSRDEVVGILLAKDLLPFVANGGEGFNIREILRPALFIPESKRLNVLLKEFRSSRNHMAIVVDEYGGVAGLVTIEDVLEQIVGDIEDEHDVDDEDSDILHVGENRYLVRALTPIEDFNEHFATGLSDEEYDTIGGLVLTGFGHMPKRGERIEMGGYRFAVLRADNRRIYLLEVTPLDMPHTPGHDAGESATANA